MALKVSVITVAYNSSSSIATAIRSVQTQTYPDIEHILIDGASSDDTLPVIRTHQTSAMKVLSEPDRGIYDAMNKGVALATGDVIGFLNADDRYAHERVIETVAAHMARDGLDALFGDVGFFRPERPDQLVRRYRSARFRLDRIAWGWMPAHPSMFLRRHVYVEAGPFKTDYRIAGDYEFVARAFSRQPISYHYLSEVLVHMRLGGISTGGWKNTWLLNREVLRACRENGLHSNMLMILSKYPLKLLEWLRP